MPPSPQGGFNLVYLGLEGRRVRSQNSGAQEQREGMQRNTSAIRSVFLLSKNRFIGTQLIKNTPIIQLGMQSSQRRCSPEGQRTGVYLLNQNYSYTPAWHAIQPDTKLARTPKNAICCDELDRMSPIALHPCATCGKSPKDLSRSLQFCGCCRATLGGRREMYCQKKKGVGGKRKGSKSQKLKNLRMEGLCSTSFLRAPITDLTVDGRTVCTYLPKSERQNAKNTGKSGAGEWDGARI